jgi:hypothetical protein
MSPRSSNGHKEPSDDLLEELDARYMALIPRDQVIGDQLEALLEQCPQGFTAII